MPENYYKIRDYQWHKIIVLNMGKLVLLIFMMYSTFLQSTVDIINSYIFFN
jgi:hypothetical protein